MLSFILTTIKLLPKQSIISVLIDLAEWASQQSDNTFDDKLVTRVKNTFDPEKIEAKRARDAKKAAK